MLINFARGITKARGGRLPVTTPHSFVGRVRAALPAALRPALEPLLEVLAQVSEQIAGYDANLTVLADQRCPETRWLLQVPRWAR